MTHVEAPKVEPMLAPDPEVDALIERMSEDDKAFLESLGNRAVKAEVRDPRDVEAERKSDEAWQKREQ